MAVHLYVQSRVELPGLVLRQETNYPWDGRIKIHVEPDKRNDSLSASASPPGAVTRRYA
ncbi:MAG: hypothetical protein WCS70_03480 [Verrucomicrobiota bacterium]